MYITLFINSSDTRKINKNISILSSANVEIKNGSSMINPIFILSTNFFDSRANYLHCNEFDRYYNINDITVNRGNIIEIKCSVDVLYTYRNDILNSQQLISRQENESNKNQVDESYILDCNMESKYYLVNNNFFNTNANINIALCVAGGL